MRSLLTFSIISLLTAGVTLAGDLCSFNYQPVCGHIGTICINTICTPTQRTYTNDCLRAQAGATFLYSGTCKIVNSEQGIVNNTTTNFSTQQDTSPTRKSVSETKSQDVGTNPPTSTADKMRDLVLIKLQAQTTLTKKITYIKTFTKQLQAQYKITTNETTRTDYEALFPLLASKLTELEQQKKQGPVTSDQGQTSNDQGPTSGNTKEQATTYQFGSYTNLQANIPSGCTVDKNGKSFIITCKNFVINLYDTTTDKNIATTDKGHNTSSSTFATFQLPLQTSNTPSFQRSGSDRYLLLQKYIRENICPKATGGQRMVTYKVLEEKKTHENASDLSIFTVCQEWKRTNKQLVAGSPSINPLKASFAQIDGIRYLITPKNPIPGPTYISDIQTFFSPAIQHLLLGNDPIAYNELLTSLLSEGKKLAETMVK